MLIPDFTAIDFETATGARNSACSVGIVRYENGKAIIKNHYFIKPPNNQYSYRNIMVHGIYAKTTENAPTFNILWHTIEPFLQNQIVVAHNASFDRSVLHETLDLYAIDLPEIIWECTYELTNMNLEDACEVYDVKLTNHHNALDDALACGNLFIKLLAGNKPSVYHKGRTKKKNIISSRFIDKKYLKPNLEDCDSSSPFYNKHIVITGTFRKFFRNEIAELLHDKGGFIQNSVNHKTDYVLAGSNMGPAKKEKAEKLGIPIISEEVFEEMIGE